MGEQRYIVTESDILAGVAFALSQKLSAEIVALLMRDIGIEIETILEDDCEEMTEEMWKKVMG